MTYGVELPLGGTDGRLGDTVRGAVAEHPAAALVQIARPEQA
ncbi:hypothetical protein [Streptomyces sp. Ag109_G2-15]|nr:hypothetical protein [Streptomyces sp. Ag109_G2-15]